ncbi:thiamine phosphate synthase [Bittarella massiliensis (ex Durand et al. 2017)]|uniref:Thiamine-phosphate synthase n=1 Tax=Bittarella massiliensis (ex Durand et al. 2017) TaxID=1720313 RepID=A0AAW5KC00_9FIRM|nr:thiamine phosphate synthase [Bittarella massiliensis (ex Durand et al. 2017)]MCQ4949462.1 thiamine phosphate synthase [Bittarella massiliensis (ex Durand et al. 2017)]
MKFSREQIKRAMRLYAVTDRAWLRGRTLGQMVEDCLKGGATFVQLREKEAGDREFLQVAREVKAVTDRYGVPLVIDDNLTIAQAVDADGVHIGQTDLPCDLARKILGPDKIIGVSTKTIAQAREAEAQGADYLGTGAAFFTTTKQIDGTLSMEEMKALCESVSIPVVAIGGIHPENLLELGASGVDGAAVVSAIFAQDDVLAATRELDELTRRLWK